MSWIASLENRLPVTSLYSVPPTLNEVRVFEIRLHQDGPRMSVRFDLNEFPDKPPSKWLLHKFNRVQLTLVFLDVHKLVIRGWSPNNIVNADIRRELDRIVLSLRGQGTEIDGVFSFADVEKISAYHSGV
jgi:hypothetical protein